MGSLQPNGNKWILKWTEIFIHHPFYFSFLFSTLVMLFALFYTSSDKVAAMEESIDVFQVMDIDKIVMPKRVRKKEIDINAEEETQETDVERAEGLSEEENAIDLSFFPNVVPPRLVGRLKKIYPEEARQREIEATVYVSLVIGTEGNVLKVNILGTRLSKPQLTEVEQSLKKAFTIAAIKIMKGARFSPPIIDGKKVSIIMEMPLQFKLD